MSIDNPFKDYPDFSQVIDNISRDGFQMHYNSMRLLYADDGVKWRRKWEPLILRWKIMAESMTKLVGTVRNHGLDDLSSTRVLSNTFSDSDVSDFFFRLHNELKTLREIEGFKRYLLLKSKNEPKHVRDFLERSLEHYDSYNERNALFSENQAVAFKNAALDFISCMETTRPMLEVGGIQLLPYEDFINCINSLKEILESVDFKPR